MKRLRIYVLHRADLHQFPRVHHTKAIDELCHQTHVVADQDDCRTEVGLHIGQGIHHLPLDHDVERTRRLVGHDDLRPQADGKRDTHALLHTATELVRKSTRVFASESDTLEQLADSVGKLPARSKPFLDVFMSSQPAVSSALQVS